MNSFTEALESANLSYDSQSSNLTGDGVQTPPTETQLTQLRLLLLKLRRKIVVEMLRQGASISAVRACVENYSSQETAEKASLNDHHDSENSRAGTINKDNTGDDDSAVEEGREATVIKIGGDGDKIHIKLEKRSVNPDDQSKKRKHILVSGDEDDADDDKNGNVSRKDDANNTPISIKFEGNANGDDDNDFKIDLTSAIDSDSNKVELIDDPDDQGLRPRKKIRVKLEDDEEEESIKLIISKDRSTGNEEDVFIPSVYRSDNPHANEVLSMGELVKTSMKELQLYDDEENQKTAKDETDYKKRKFAVSEFPKSDLKDMLPGEIPMIDFSGPKPTQQVAWNSFTAYIEPFYRNFTEEDVKWLRQKCVASTFLSKYLLANEGFVATENSEDANAENKGIISGNGNKEARPLDNTYNPYYIPPLGPRYLDVWALENEGKPVKMGRLTQSLASKMKKLYAPKGSPGNFDANKPDALVALCEEQDKVSCGPLTSRILSAIVSDDEDDVFELDENEVDGENGEESHNDASAFKRDDKISFEQLEKRLNRELKYIGIFMNVVQTLNNSSWEQDWALGKEDDEVSSELRILQNELTKVQQRNNFRKEILVPMVEEQIAWQEYMTIVDDLDKQVEQHYRRRLNVTPKKTKKRGPHSSHSGGDSSSSGLMKDDAAHLVSNASFRGLLEKRRRWIEKIGSLFKSPLEMRRMPKQTVFKVEQEEEEGDGEKEEGGAEAEVTTVEEGEAAIEGARDEQAEGEEVVEQKEANGREASEGEKIKDNEETNVNNDENNDDESEKVEKDTKLKEKDNTSDVTEKAVEKKTVAKDVKVEANAKSTTTTAITTAGNEEEDEDEENEEDEEDENEEEEEEDDEDEDEEDDEDEDDEGEDDDEEMAAIEEEPEEEEEEDDDEQDDDDDNDDEDENEEDDDDD